MDLAKRRADLAARHAQFGQMVSYAQEQKLRVEGAIALIDELIKPAAASDAGETAAAMDTDDPRTKSILAQLSAKANGGTALTPVPVIAERELQDVPL